MPGLSEVKYSQILTNIAVAYKNENFIADEVFPKLPSKNDTGYYFEKGRENFRLKETLRAPGTPAAKIDYSMTKHLYSTDEHALCGDIPKKFQKNAVSPISPISDLTEELSESMLLAKEKATIDLITDYSSTFSSYCQQLASYNASTNSYYVYMDDYTNADPFYIVSLLKRKMLKACGKYPNVMVINPDTEATIANHPKEKARHQYVKDLLQDTLPDTWNGLKVVRAISIYDSSVEGATATSDSFLFGNYIFLAYVEKNPGLWKSSMGHCYEHEPLKVKTWYDEVKDTTFVQLGFDYTLEVISARCGFVVYDVLENVPT